MIYELPGYTCPKCGTHEITALEHEIVSIDNVPEDTVGDYAGAKAEGAIYIELTRTSYLTNEPFIPFCETDTANWYNANDYALEKPDTHYISFWCGGCKYFVADKDHRMSLIEGKNHIAGKGWINPWYKEES